MAKVIGLDVLLQANTGTTAAPSYTTVGGQTDATLNLDSDAIDVSSKDGAGWREKMAGLKDWNMDLECVIKTGDAGVSALTAAFLAGTDIMVQILMPDGETYAGTAIITSAPVKTPQDDKASYSFKIEGNGALTLADRSVDTPSITNPTLAETDISVTETCTSSAFAVSSGSDTHLASQWQITTAADTTWASPILDSESTIDLVSMTVPGGTLSASTEYLIRVRHKGTLLGWSAWSAIGHNFTTAA